MSIKEFTCKTHFNSRQYTRHDVSLTLTVDPTMPCTVRRFTKLSIKKFAILDARQATRHVREMPENQMLEILFSEQEHALREMLLFKTQDLSPGESYRYNFSVDLLGKDKPLKELPLALIFNLNVEPENVSLVIPEDTSRNYPQLTGKPREVETLLLTDLQGATITMTEEGLNIVK